MESWSTESVLVGICHTIRSWLSPPLSVEWMTSLASKAREDERVFRWTCEVPVEEHREFTNSESAVQQG